MERRYVCNVCNRKFARSAHFRRHQASHGEQAAVCRICDKQFSRSDTLRRHERTHQTTQKSLLSEGSRACFACAASKLRCTGALPCTRCVSKHLECVYPENPRFRAKATLSPRRTSPSTVSRQEQDDESFNFENLPAIDPASGVTERTLFESVEPDPPSPGYGGQLASDMAHTSTVPLHDSMGRQELALNSIFWNPTDWTSLNWLPTNFASEALPETQSIGTAVTFQSPVNTAELATDPYALKPTDDIVLNKLGFQGLDIPNSLDTWPYFDPIFRIPGGSHGAQTSSFSLLHPDLIATEASDLVPLSETLYSQLNQQYNMQCLVPGIFLPFSPAQFPSREMISGLLQKYLKHFHPMVPIVHHTRPFSSDTHWLLVLAMAAIGSHYVNHGFAISMQEFLRRSILVAEEGSFGNCELDDLTIVQVGVLQAIGGGYVGGRHLFRSSMRKMSDLISFCTSQWVSSAFELPHGSSFTWDAWMQSEEKLRVGYAIWMLDCMWHYQHNRPSSLTLEHAACMPMPCLDTLWAANNELEWQAAKEYYATDRIIFLDTLQGLYAKRHLPKNVSDFGRLLLIHAVFHQTWEVQRHVHQGLSCFEPTAERQSSTSQGTLAPIWPPSVPLFNKWRNAACDCLDILHSTISQDSPTFLHCHIARIVLLSPLYHIIRLASHLVGNTRGTPLPSSAKDANEDRRLIRWWTTQDEAKARQAVVHAGVLFWHMRRFSINAFYEPTAVALATLMLWAYASFTIRIQRPGISTQRLSSDSDEDCPGRAILLDRPIDKELVETFVRDGRNMQAIMEGVGDLNEAKAPRRILRAGRQVLQSLRAWDSSSEGWLMILRDLPKTGSWNAADTSRSCN